MTTNRHNPYFSRWFSAIRALYKSIKQQTFVTILILVDGFLQLLRRTRKRPGVRCHNPYFSRWFSAILKHSQYTPLNSCHNPYFSRWFSAIISTEHPEFNRIQVTILILVDGFLQQQQFSYSLQLHPCHNPYFSRWFSAIHERVQAKFMVKKSQSLFQQMVFCNNGINTVEVKNVNTVTILILVDGFLQSDAIIVYDTDILSQSLFQQMVFCNVIKWSLKFQLLKVTILILVDGFLQLITQTYYK